MVSTPTKYITHLPLDGCLVYRGGLHSDLEVAWSLCDCNSMVLNIHRVVADYVAAVFVATVVARFRY